MTESMIQRVAKAIDDASTYGPEHPKWSTELHEVARAAIEAMRQIPDGYFSILVRSFNMLDDEQHRTVARLWYQRMIDEALK